MLKGGATAPLDGSVGEGFDEYLFYLLTQVQNRRARGFAPRLEALGLTMSHWRALSTINRLGGCLMSELAEFTTTDRTTLTRTMDQLVETGLVNRVGSKGDRRLVRVELSDAGQAKHAEAVDALIEYNEQALKGFSAEDQRTLRALLQRMLRNVLADNDLFEDILHYRH